jgi:flagella basal body P-ring formation protein FlgA
MPKILSNMVDVSSGILKQDVCQPARPAPQAASASQTATCRSLTGHLVGDCRPSRRRAAKACRAGGARVHRRKRRPRLSRLTPHARSAAGWHGTCFLLIVITEASICRRWFAAAALAAAPLWVVAAIPTAAELQDVPALEESAGVEAQRLLPPLKEGQRLQVGPVPPGLRLARCETAVKAAAAPGLKMPGRALIELRCDGRPPWHLYVPAKIVGTAPVVLAAHSLVAGSVLRPADLTVDRRDMVGLPPGYLDDPSLAVGLTVVRGVPAGSILTNQQLLGVQAVKRGQSVTLIANAGGITVRMAGRALTDGFVNERIKVQNLSSGKTVEGIARSDQVVEILF